MRTLYESDNGKTYKTEQEAKEADAKYLAEQKKADVAKKERKEASERVLDAYKDVAKANKKAKKEMEKFLNQYGSFYLTLEGDQAKEFFDNPIDTFFDFADHLFF
jgi:hypothetical protein